MSSKQYESQDAAIIKAASLGRHPLYYTTAREEADRIANATGREVFRIIDARMRALVKAGQIEFDRAQRAWNVVRHEELHAVVVA